MPGSCAAVLFALMPRFGVSFGVAFFFGI